MVNIYVVAHKPVEIDKYNLDKCYKIIRVGKYGQADSSLLNDSSGDNIAYKNPNYSELTAQYWIWKNDKKSDIVGLCHYRRFFSNTGLSSNPKYFLNEKKIIKYLNEADAIVPRKNYFSKGVYYQYMEGGSENDLKNAEEALQLLYPEYIPYYKKYLKNSCGTRLCNMIITKKDIFDAYSRWLFDILGYVEEHTDMNTYPPEWQRVFGCVSERLLEVWLKANHIKVKSVWMVNTEDKKLRFLTRFKRVIGLSGLKARIIYAKSVKENKNGKEKH